jgi:F-type H+-transporting ATPase subunit c
MLGLMSSVLAEVAPVATEAAQAAVGLGNSAFGLLGGLLGCGFIVIGAGIGVGIVAGHATEAIARQPEAGGRIFTTMIIAASMIEGIALFGMVICFIAVWKSLGQ